MRVLIDIQQPLDPSINQSYIPLGFYKFGAGWWQYGNYSGAVEFINSMHWCSEPKYNNPTAFNYVLFGTTQAIHQLVPSPLPNLSPVQIAGILFNALEGTNMPMKLT